MKKAIIITGVIIAAAVLIWLSAVSGGFMILSYLMPDPLKPDIRYGEFPFSLTYESDGEITVIEDVLICEYDGSEIRESGEKSRKWKYSFESGRTELVLLDLTVRAEINEFGHTMQYLYFFFGTPEYFMGDTGHYRCRPPQALNEVSYRYLTADGISGASAYDADTVYEKYGIRIIGFEIADPLKNSFG